MTHPIPVLLYEIIQDLRARNPSRAPLIGVAGAQGAGKSYQCRLLAMANQPRFAHFSLDDVYMGHAERQERAAAVHPLRHARRSGNAQFGPRADGDKPAAANEPAYKRAAAALRQGHG